MSVMPIDTTPSTVATNALQSIPFSAIIGGPLQAAIDAQAMAATSTMNFINSVGFNTDAQGNRTAIQVVFTYQQGGQMTNLIVPLLVIVPIPYIAVNTITIDFTASINAASSSVASQNSETDTSASGSVGYSGWGLTANFSANYSSKQGSTASQDSKYSVEYTLKIHVEAGQEDMPAGLQTVLNILAGSSTTANPNGSFQVQMPSPTPLNFPATVTGTLLGATGVAVPNTQVTIGPIPGATNPTVSPSAVTTDGNGQFQFQATSLTVGSAPVSLSASLPGAPSSAASTINVPFTAANPGALSVSVSSNGTSAIATLLDQNGNPVAGNQITFASSDTAATFNGAATAQVTTDATGATPAVTVATTSASSPCTATASILPGAIPSSTGTPPFTAPVAVANFTISGT